MKKKIYIISSILLVIVIGVILFFIFQRNSEEDNIKFAKEYSISTNNVFVYRDIDEIIRIMKYGTGVVYLGFPECSWCKAYVKYLNEVALDVGIDEIYYYNIFEDRKNKTENYQRLVALLGDNLQYDNEGNHRIYVPNVSFHVGGEIIGNDYETSLDTHGLSDPKEYWTFTEVADLKKKLTEYMQEVFEKVNSCTECNK